MFSNGSMAALSTWACGTEVSMSAVVHPLAKTQKAVSKVAASMADLLLPEVILTEPFTIPFPSSPETGRHRRHRFVCGVAMQSQFTPKQSLDALIGAASLILVKL